MHTRHPAQGRRSLAGLSPQATVDELAEDMSRAAVVGSSTALRTCQESPEFPDFTIGLLGERGSAGEGCCIHRYVPPSSVTRVEVCRNRRSGSTA